MSVHEQPVESVKIISVLEKFLKLLQKFHNIISVAHNGRRFPGFIDSLAVFLKKISRQTYYKQDMTLYEPRHEKTGFLHKLCKNKDAGQLCGDRTADQRLFCYADSTIPLLP